MNRRWFSKLQFYVARFFPIQVATEIPLNRFFSPSCECVWSVREADLRCRNASFPSGVSVKYLDWLFRLSLLPPYYASFEQEGGGRYRWRLFGAHWCFNWFEPGNLTLQVPRWLYRNGLCVSQHSDVRMERGCDPSFSFWQLLTGPHWLSNSSSGPEATGAVREGSTHWGLGD